MIIYFSSLLVVNNLGVHAEGVALLDQPMTPKKWIFQNSYFKVSKIFYNLLRSTQIKLKSQDLIPGLCGI